MSGASGSENTEAFHVYLHRNLPLYLYNCILVAGFDKPHVFTSLVEPAAVNKMEDYVRNCVVPALTSRDERQRYVGLFADKPQLFQISPGHRIQLLMLVKECRTNKNFDFSTMNLGSQLCATDGAHPSDVGSEAFRRRLSENDTSIIASSVPTSKLNINFNPGSITSSFAGYKRKSSDSSPTIVSPAPSIPIRSQGLHLNPCSSPQSRSHHQPLSLDSSHQMASVRPPVTMGMPDDTSSSTGLSSESEHLNRVAFQPGNNTTQYASPLSVEEHERRILRLLERWVRAQQDPVIQNLRRDVDFQLTVTRLTENDVVTAKVVCLRCKKSVALVGRGDTWVLSNYHRHLRSCLSSDRHITYMASSALNRDDLMHHNSLSQKSPDSFLDNCKVDVSNFDVSNLRERGASETGNTRHDGQLLISQMEVANGRPCGSLQKFNQFTMKTESMASDISIVDDSESENGISSVATPREQESAE